MSNDKIETPVAQPPSIGRIVHFHAAAGDPGPYAGIVVRVLPGTTNIVDLANLGPNSLYFNHSVPFSPAPHPGCWSWPPRV